MKNKLFTIGQTSKIKGITVKALRFYERIGLINPCYIDASTKYRYYSQEQFFQLDVIKALRSVDVSPKEIVGILKKRDTGQLMEYLDEQKENIQARIFRLQKTIRAIEQTQNTVSYSISAIGNPELTIRALPKRYIITQQIKKDASEEEALALFSKFPRIIEENNLLDTYETGLYCRPDEIGEFHPTLIYNAVIAYKGSNKALVSTIPAGEYLCICFCARNPQPQMEKLTNYLKQNQMQPRLLIQVNLMEDVFAANTQYCETQVLL